MKSGIVIISELSGDVRAHVLEIQRRFDPRLADGLPPHLTLVGSSGMGPIASGTTAADLRGALEPIARDTPPMTMKFGRPIQFMQSNVIVLPLDPHGPLRVLHDRIANSGLLYERARFTFTPHVTLNLFRELSSKDIRALLSERVDEPVTFDHIAAHRTTDVVSSSKLLDLPLTGAGTGYRGVRKRG